MAYDQGWQSLLRCLGHNIVEFLNGGLNDLHLHIVSTLEAVFTPQVLCGTAVCDKRRICTDAHQMPSFDCAAQPFNNQEQPQHSSCISHVATATYMC